MEMTDREQHRYFIYFSYDGTEYHGWQAQPNAVTVQQRMQEALSLLLQRPVGIVGAGRTDTGVHARMMVALFDSETTLDVRHLAFKMNCLLPNDIAVSRIRPVQPTAHARFSPLSRMYRYYLALQKDAFLPRFACRFFIPLDFDRMNEAAGILLHHTEYGSFCKAHSDNKTNICHITQAQWRQASEGMWYFEIRADRFLRSMVRSIVGTLLQVGKGDITPQDFERIILQNTRTAAGDSVPAHGLFLEDIVYPDSIFL